MKPLYVFVAWIGVTVALHTLCVILGIYDSQIANNFVWVDNILHMLVGAGVAHAAWVHIQNFLFALVSICILAFAWEVVEYFVYIMLPEVALAYKVYSPTLYEAGEDVVSNMVGGILILLVLVSRKKVGA